jgi:hypothetical protein
MSNPEFKIGDVVVLKSGGILMTVTKMISMGEFAGTVSVTHTNSDGDIIQNLYPPEVLRFPDPNGKPNSVGSEEGLTKRERFAGQIMASMMPHGYSNPYKVAVVSVIAADELIAALSLTAEDLASAFKGTFPAATESQEKEKQLLKAACLEMAATFKCILDEASRLPPDADKIIARAKQGLGIFNRAP